MPPVIRIDDDVFQHLQKQAVPLVDTPNDVLRRVFGFNKSPLKPKETNPVPVTKRRQMVTLPDGRRSTWAKVAKAHGLTVGANSAHRVVKGNLPLVHEAIHKASGTTCIY